MMGGVGGEKQKQIHAREKCVEKNRAKKMAKKKNHAEGKVLLRSLFNI